MPNWKELSDRIILAKDPNADGVLNTDYTKLANSSNKLRNQPKPITNHVNKMSPVSQFKPSPILLNRSPSPTSRGGTKRNGPKRRGTKRSDPKRSGPKRNGSCVTQCAKRLAANPKMANVKQILQAAVLIKNPVTYLTDRAKYDRIYEATSRKIIHKACRKSCRKYSLD
jgi:hypothetical protein